MSDRRNGYFGMEMFWTLVYAVFGLITSFFSYNGRAIHNISLILRSTEKDTRPFQVFIYEDELENIREWVRKKTDIETGGDLFGLWIDQHTVVVQLVLGPGEKCRRSETSFYQDLDYLAQSGEAITKGHGLCNIGQWHSHHRLGLPRPSSGDETTVWENMPGLGLNRFVVFIATIEGVDSLPEVNIEPFLFEIQNETGDKLPVIKGHFNIMPETQCSPFRLNGDLMSQLKMGAESMNKTTTLYKEMEKLGRVSVNGRRSYVAIDI